MGVDHGLGGRDNEKSKKRREQKAKRLKNLAKSLRTEGLHNRNEVKFDEAARVAFITGFRKRKLERRKYGIAMQLLKDKKQRKDAQREKVKILMETNQETMDQNDDDEVKVEETTDSSHILVQNTFDDDATRNMFGSAVSVVVSDDIKDKNEEFFTNEDEDDEDNQDGNVDEDEDDNRSRTSYKSVQSSFSQKSHRSQKGNRKELTPFQRAISKAKQLIGNKKKKSHHIDRSQHLNRNQKKQIKSSKLLTKAFNTQKIKMKR